MSSYTVSDFAMSLSEAQISPDEVESVVASWGVSGDYAEWWGGFLMHMQNGQYHYLTGWCDTSGWGCQDGVDVTVFDTAPALESLKPEAEWDEEPIDLNRYLKDGNKFGDL